MKPRLRTRRCGPAGLAVLAAMATLPAATRAQEVAPAEPTAAPQQVQVQGQRVRGAAGKSTLDHDELARVPGSGGDPMRAVQSLPGVANVDDSSADPAVRGARPSDNAYYVDFLPVGYLFHVGGFASVFNADLIRHFDLASAAWSPEYGDVVGAVFDVSLRSPRTDRVGGKLDFSLLGASVLVEGPLNDSLSFFLSGRRSWFDLVAKTAESDEEGVSFTMPVYSDVQGRLLWTLNAEHSLRLDFSTANDRIAFDLSSESKAAQRDPVLTGHSALRQSYRTLAATWEASLHRHVNHTLALGQITHDESTSLGSAGRYELRATTTYLRQQLQWQASRDHLVLVGGSINSRLIELDLDFKDPRCTEFDPHCDLTNAPRVLSMQHTRQNLADLYVNNRWRFAPQWTATGGVRVGHDGYSRQRFAEPRVGLEWAWSQDTVLSVGLGRHNQPPPAEQSLKDIGNPSLRHLRSNHAVLGVAQQLGSGWSWRVEAYAKTFDGYAVTDPQLRYRNGASGTAQGIELLVKKHATERLSGFASLSVSKARRQHDGTGEQFPFEFDQPVIASVVSQYKLSDRWQFGAKWSYHTGAPYTPVTGTSTYPDGRVRPLYGGINSQRVPSYHRLDLRVDWKRSDTLTAYVELINAYGRKNVSGYSYSADYRQRETVYQMPAFISVGVQHRF